MDNLDIHDSDSKRSRMSLLERQPRHDPQPAAQKRCLTLATEVAVADNTPVSKKQKHDHRYIPPPDFWDGLSTIPLTCNALRELDRRNRCSDDCCSHIAFTTGQKVNCERFARHSGPDLSNLQGCRIPVAFCHQMSSSQSSLGRRKRGSQSSIQRTTQSLSKSTSTFNTTSTRSFGPYDRAFQQNLIDHGIFPDGYLYPDGTSPPKPDNMEEILQILAQRRASLSPSECSTQEFENFRRADTHAFTESDVTTNVIPLIEGTLLGGKCVARDVPFTNLKDLTNGTIVAGKPDLYYGSQPEQLDIRVRRELSRMIIPSTQGDLPILPNFSLEVKGPEGIPSVATRQSSYNGALGARGMQSLQSYGHPSPRYDNKAYTISCTYQVGLLKIFTCHPIPPRDPGKEPGFVTTQIQAYCLTGNEDNFRQGVAAFRNARDWAKRQRDTAIEQANKLAKG